MPSSAAFLPSLEPENSSSGAVSARSVLLVEDEDPLAELLTHLLRRLDVRVLRAANGTEARALFAEKRAEITMAFVDCQLPDMAGADLCQELRVAAPRLPLLLTSGRDQRALEAQFAVDGPCQFLPKPYMPAEVMRRVSALLAAAG